MKVAWFNDYNLSQYIGGASITNSIMIQTGIKKGYEIKEFDHKTEFDPTTDLLDFDLIILNNINLFDSEKMTYILENYKYVNYIHDYGFCEYRNANCELCTKACIPAPFFRKLFINSSLNIFLSPLHLEIHKKHFGMILRDAIYIPSPMIKGQFIPNLNKQTKEALFAGVILSHKGIYQILDFAESEGLKLDVAGKAIAKHGMIRIKEKHNYLGEFKHEDMPSIYQQYKSFLINPLWNEPFGRTIAEAIASGCKIVKFEKSFKTGFESYNLPPEDLLNICYDAPDIFWKEVTRC